MKYLIIYNAGYGEDSQVIEADTQEQADEEAYQAWREIAENNAVYRAEPLTKDNAENYGHKSELEDGNE